jgi:Peptidase_C39 like family
MVMENFDVLCQGSGAGASAPQARILRALIGPLHGLGKMDICDGAEDSSCVGFVLCSMLEIVPVAVGVIQDESERFIWHNSKVNDGLGNPNTNRGTFIPTAIATTQRTGSCWETKCPYTSPLTTPSAVAYAAARYMKVTRAYRLTGNTLNHYKGMLSIGWPVIVGFDIFGNAEYRRRYLTGEYTMRTGIMRMPPAPIPGRTNGHAVVFVGYDDNTRLMKFKNSWGMRGDRDYFYMPYDYLRFTRDAWVLWGQEIRLPVSVDGVTVSATGAVASTEEGSIIVTEGKQPSGVHEVKGQAPRSE